MKYTKEQIINALTKAWLRNGLYTEDMKDAFNDYIDLVHEELNIK